MDLARISVITVFTLTSFLAVSLFLAPASLESGTVTDLDANANMLDYQDKWNDLPLFPKLVYYFGDFNCHQKSERSFYVNGNQMPVCARDVGVFTGTALGVLPLLFIPLSIYVTETMTGVLPSRMQKKVLEKKIYKWSFIIGLAFICVLPLVIDGTYQLISQASAAIPNYESTNLVRVVTGLFFGGFGGYWIGAMVASLFKITQEE